MIMHIIQQKLKQPCNLQNKSTLIKKLLRFFNHIHLLVLAALLDEFADSLETADHIYLCDIFSSAREKTGIISINELLQKLPSAKHLELENIEELEQHGNAVYLFMGAGDVQKYLNAFKELVNEETA